MQNSLYCQGLSQNIRRHDYKYWNKYIVSSIVSSLGGAVVWPADFEAELATLEVVAVARQRAGGPGGALVEEGLAVPGRGVEEPPHESRAPEAGALG